MSEVFGAVTVEQKFQRGQPLERDALRGELVRQGHGFVLLGKNVLNLPQSETLWVRPKEQALVAVILHDRAEAKALDLAPSTDRAGEGILCLFQRIGRRLLAQGGDLVVERARGGSKRRIARTDDLGERGLGDRRVIRLGVRAVRAHQEQKRGDAGK